MKQPKNKDVQITVKVTPQIKLQLRVLGAKRGHGLSKEAAIRLADSINNKPEVGNA